MEGRLFGQQDDGDERAERAERDEPLTRSILGLEALHPELPRPPAPDAAEAIAFSPPPTSHSFLHLEDAKLTPLPPPEAAAGRATGRNGARPYRSFFDLASDAGRPLPLSGGPPPRLRTDPEAASDAREAGHSLLGLPSRVEPARPLVRVASAGKGFAHAPVGAGLARPRDERWAPPDPTSGLFVELERRSDRAFPVERGILISLALHFLLVFLVGRYRGPGGEANPGLLAALRSPPKSADHEVPIIFHEAPGPERANPRRSEFSDKNRVAGGGDRAKPKSDTPFIPELRGKEGLTPGAGRTAAARPPAGTESGRGSRPTSGSPSRSASTERPPEVLAEDRPSPADTRQPAAGGGTAGAAPGSPSRGLPDLSNVIQREAQNSLNRGAGENGAGIPNPDGGFVDSGPISFETSWYDWGPYAEEMVRRIKLHWDIPQLALLGWKGKLTIHFNIRVDGSVEGATLISGSSIPPFDFAAMQAILKSNPFRPLPKELLRLVPGKTKEGITVTFFYNIRPEHEGSSGGNR